MTSLVLHASCVARNGRGVLIRGSSGAGKSGLALQLLAFGADLVSDDRTEIWSEGPRLLARAPDTIQGLIEARGVGILRLSFLPIAEISLVIDLDQTESERLPPRRRVNLLGIDCDLVLGSRHTHFPASILCYLDGSREA